MSMIIMHMYSAPILMEEEDPSSDSTKYLLLMKMRPLHLELNSLSLGLLTEDSENIPANIHTEEDQAAPLELMCAPPPKLSMIVGIMQ